MVYRLLAKQGNLVLKPFKTDKSFEDIFIRGERIKRADLEVLDNRRRFYKLYGIPQNETYWSPQQVFMTDDYTVVFTSHKMSKKIA